MAENFDPREARAEDHSQDIQNQFEDLNRFEDSNPAQVDAAVFGDDVQQVQGFVDEAANGDAQAFSQMMQPGSEYMQYREELTGRALDNGQIKDPEAARQLLELNGAMAGALVERTKGVAKDLTNVQAIEQYAGQPG